MNYLKFFALFALIFAAWHFSRQSVFYLPSDLTVPGVAFVVVVSGIYLLYGHHRKQRK